MHDSSLLHARLLEFWLRSNLLFGAFIRSPHLDVEEKTRHDEVGKYQSVHPVEKVDVFHNGQVGEGVFLQKQNSINKHT